MKKAILITLFTMLMIFTAACGSNNKSDDNAKNDTSKSETLKVEHELGTTDVPKNPKKVVVFDYGILDTLDKLGVEVAGVPQSSSMPKYLKDKGYQDEKYENVGSLKEPDFEKIAEIDPDLIIISGRQSSVYDQLKEIAPTVYLGVDTTKYMESFKHNMEVAAAIFDKKEEVTKSLEELDQSIADLQEKAKNSGNHALIILANDDKISAYGPKSRFGLIHDVFGVPAVDENIEASVHGKNVSFEYVVEQNPDMLYVIDRGAAIGEESSAKQVVENKLVEKTNAYKNDHIVYLDPDFWYLSGGGLVSVQEMVNEVSESLN